MNKLSGLQALKDKIMNDLQSKRQMHPLHPAMLETLNFSMPDTTYAVIQATTRELDWKVYNEVLNKLNKTSKLMFIASDNFVYNKLIKRYGHIENVIVTTEKNMPYDIPLGNPIFYYRNEVKGGNTNSNAGLAYDDHITKAVNNKTGNKKNNGPFVVDHAWFQGGSSHGTFRKWLFEDFGLKEVIILDSADFDVDEGSKGLCMIYGEDGYTGDITIKNLINNEEYSSDFRSLGYIIPNKSVLNIVLDTITSRKYEWHKTSIRLKLDEEGKIVEGPKEVPGGSIRVLKTLLLDKEPEFYFTEPEYITDWSDFEEERFATRYQPATGRKRWQEIAVGVVIPPRTIIPGEMLFTYTNLDKGTGETHKKHLMSAETTKILKHTRTGLSLHTPQTRCIPYATEFEGYTAEQKEILNEL